MSLFKTSLIKHDILNFVEDDFLTLHCSRSDCIKAPFDASLTVGNASCVLKINDIELFISHVNVTTNADKVKAGDIIGQPIVDGMFGQNTAYILVKIYKGGKLDDIVKYLRFKDKTKESKEEKKEVVVEVKETVIDEVTKTEYEAITEVEVEVKPKKTTTKKKSSSKKKKK